MKDHLRALRRYHAAVVDHRRVVEQAKPTISITVMGRCANPSYETAEAMKISLDVDCTPDELRGFFGLPDVKPMQEQLLKEVEERMRASLKALDPETMLKTWLPAGLKGFEQLQEMFLNAGRGAGKK
jgi:hypothetical protein